MYDFLVMGHPRTGTGYMSKLLKHLGYDVGHETFGVNGISNWAYSVDNVDRLPTHGPDSRRDEQFYKHMLMVVRDPCTAIRSIVNTDNLDKVSLNYRLYYLRGDLLDMNKTEIAIYMYCNWIKNIKRQYPDISVIHVEDAKREIMEYFDIHSIPVIIDEHEPPKNYNTRNHNGTYIPIDFSEVSPICRDMLKEFCHTYGYKCNCCK